MNLLAIDTSSDNCSLGILWNDKVRLDYNRFKPRSASELFAYLDKSLRRLKLDFKKFDALVLGAGPGSFTGLRISFAAAKAWSLAIDLPVITVGSFASIAYRFKHQQEKIAVVADARRGLIYGATYLAKGGVLRREKKETLISLEDFIRDKKTYFFVTYDTALRDAALGLEPGLRFHGQDVFPNAKSLIFLAAGLYSAKKFTPLDKLQPLYLHPKTCQIRKKV